MRGRLSSYAAGWEAKIFGSQLAIKRLMQHPLIEACVLQAICDFMSQPPVCSKDDKYHRFRYNQTRSDRSEAAWWLFSDDPEEFDNGVCFKSICDMIGASADRARQAIIELKLSPTVQTWFIDKDHRCVRMDAIRGLRSSEEKDDGRFVQVRQAREAAGEPGECEAQRVHENDREEQHRESRIDHQQEHPVLRKRRREEG